MRNYSSSYFVNNRSYKKDGINTSEKIFTEEEIKNIYEKLKALTNAPEETRKKHIDDIEKRIK